MRRLRVDLEDIAMAMETQLSEHESYLDTETGDVVIVPHELQGEEIFDEGYVQGLPKWEQDLVPQAKEMLQDSDRYAAIPTAPSYEEYDLMVEFTGSVSDPRLRDLLTVAIDGKGAFGRFKRVLLDHPRERDAGRVLRRARPEVASETGHRTARRRGASAHPLDREQDSSDWRGSPGTRRRSDALHWRRPGGLVPGGRLRIHALGPVVSRRVALRLRRLVG